jgi:hypothetical protein
VFRRTLLSISGLHCAIVLSDVNVESRICLCSPQHHVQNRKGAALPLCIYCRMVSVYLTDEHVCNRLRAVAEFLA